jgi:hypothetical protein
MLLKMWQFVFYRHAPLQCHGCLERLWAHTLLAIRRAQGKDYICIVFTRRLACARRDLAGHCQGVKPWTRVGIMDLPQ